jgi:hypothetical protein
VIAIATLLVVALLMVLVTRIATLALVLTGMSHEAARFQARSALSGTGFTTTEAESVVGHPVRRRIIMMLMLLGGAGIVTTVATLVIGFARTSGEQALMRLGVLVVALLVLVVLVRSQWFGRVLDPLLGRPLTRYTDLEAQDYTQLLHLGDWAVSELDDRHAGAPGHRAHLAAIAEQRRTEAAEDERRFSRQPRPEGSALRPRP